jgi:hypothetical protein
LSTTTRRPPSATPILDAVLVLDLLCDWVAAVNDPRQTETMKSLQQTLRLEHGVSICLMGKRPGAVHP